MNNTTYISMYKYFSVLVKLRFLTATNVIKSTNKEPVILVKIFKNNTKLAFEINIKIIRTTACHIKKKHTYFENL